MRVRLVAKTDSDSGSCVILDVDGREVVVAEEDNASVCLEDGFRTWSAGPPNETEIRADREYVGKPFGMYCRANGEDENCFSVVLHNAERETDDSNCRLFTLADLEKGVDLEYRGGRFTTAAHARAR